jgi:hypothetical protein
MTRRRKTTYPGLEDPRAALAELAGAYAYVIQLQRRFHIAHPAYGVLQAVNEALRAAALELTHDPHFFGLGLASQVGSRPEPPPAPPVPGRWPPPAPRR